MKPIHFSQHALARMRQRGATESEVQETIETATWSAAKHGKLQARKDFAFRKRSPVNQETYRSKVVEAIFTEKEAEIVVISVLVYYENQGE